MSQVSAALMINDEICRERDYYESLLKQNGIEPYELPNSDRNKKSSPMDCFFITKE